MSYVSVATRLTYSKCIHYSGLSVATLCTDSKVVINCNGSVMRSSDNMARI